MPSSTAVMIARLLAMWARTLTPRSCAAWMAAASSSGLTSSSSGSPFTAWPAVAKILMYSAPRLISSRTPRRKPSGPSHLAMPGCWPPSQYQGKARSCEWAVVETSRLPTMTRGPGISPSSTALRREASMACGAPALITLVKPLLSASAIL